MCKDGHPAPLPQEPPSVIRNLRELTAELVTALHRWATR